MTRKFKIGDQVVRIVRDRTVKRKILLEVALVTIIEPDARFSEIQSGWVVVDYGNGVSGVSEKTLFTKDEAKDYLNKWLEA